MYKRDQLITELREWKRTRTTRLGANQAYHAEYDLADIQRQQTSSLKTRIEILTIAEETGGSHASQDKNSPHNILYPTATPVSPQGH